MLRIIGKVKEEISNEISTDFCNDNVIGFFIDYSERNIPIGTIFDTLYFKKEIEKVNFELIYVTDQTFLEFDLLEIGYKTICFFKFNSKSSMVGNIPYVDNWYDYDDLYSLGIMRELDTIDIGSTR